MQTGDDDKHQNGREIVNTHTCEYEIVTMLWDQWFTHREVTANRPDIIIKNKKERQRMQNATFWQVHAATVAVQNR